MFGESSMGRGDGSLRSVDRRPRADEVSVLGCFITLRSLGGGVANIKLY